MERRIAALIAGALNHRDDSAWEASVSGLVSATATGTPHPTRQIGDASGRWAVLEEVPRSPALPFQAGPAFSLPEQAHGGPAAWSSRCAIAGCGRNRRSGVERDGPSEDVRKFNQTKEVPSEGPRDLVLDSA